MLEGDRDRQLTKNNMCLTQPRIKGSGRKSRRAGKKNLREYASWGDEGYFVCRRERMQHVQPACSDTYTPVKDQNWKTWENIIRFSESIYFSFFLPSTHPHPHRGSIYSIIGWQHIRALLKIWCLIAVASMLRLCRAGATCGNVRRGNLARWLCDWKRACLTICFNAVFIKRETICAHLLRLYLKNPTKAFWREDILCQIRFGCSKSEDESEFYSCLAPQKTTTFLF